LPGIVTKDCSIVCFIASLFLNLRQIKWTFLGFTISAEDKVNAEPKYAGRYLTKPDINGFVGKGHQPPTVEQTGNGQSTGGKRLPYLTGNERPG